MSTIDLQDGFDHEPTRLRINGHEVFRSKSVTTSPLTGIAQHIPATHTIGPAVIEISLEGMQVEERIEIEEVGVFNLGVYIEDGKVKHRMSKEPFGYA